jgi:hypothetical protein
MAPRDSGPPTRTAASTAAVLPARPSPLLGTPTSFPFAVGFDVK